MDGDGFDGAEAQVLAGFGRIAFEDRRANVSQVVLSDLDAFGILLRLYFLPKRFARGLCIAINFVVVENIHRTVGFFSVTVEEDVGNVRCPPRAGACRFFRGVGFFCADGFSCCWHEKTPFFP